MLLFISCLGNGNNYKFILKFSLYMMALKKFLKENLGSFIMTEIFNGYCPNFYILCSVFALSWRGVNEPSLQTFIELRCFSVKNDSVKIRPQRSSVYDLKIFHINNFSYKKTARITRVTHIVLLLRKRKNFHKNLFRRMGKFLEHSGNSCELM